MTAPSADPDAFRASVRGWFAQHATPRSGARFAGEGADRERAAKWFRALSDAGFVGLTWPVEHGGAGLPVAFERILRGVADRYEETAEDVYGVAVGLAGPALIAHGTARQQAEHLPAILAGDEVWCQLFSEPGAGSDLASLQTTAVPRGTTFVVNGQKVWSSGAHFSDYGLLLARTDPSQRGARGISCFVVAMDAPGVEVRPLRQLTGDAHFNEVFLTDVVLARDDLLGELHGGWAVTQTVLDAERALIGVGGGLSVPVEPLILLARGCGRTADPVVRSQLTAGYERERVIDQLSRCVAARDVAGESSLVKLAMADHVERTADLALTILGAHALLARDELGADAASWLSAFYGQWLLRIGGGTAQIQRNIVAERLLGLPSEPR